MPQGPWDGDSSVDLDPYVDDPEELLGEEIKFNVKVCLPQGPGFCFCLVCVLPNGGGGGLGGNDTNKSTGRSGRQNAATRRNMRREERVTVQGPVKEQQPDGMSHGGGGVW